MNCPNCKAEVNQQANFCSLCGIQLKEWAGNSGGETNMVEPPDASPLEYPAGPSAGEETPPRILVVDDSPSAQRYVTKTLAAMEALVETADDGVEALNRMADSPFDLIITDLEMPRMNGIEFCTRLKSLPEYRDIPVIIISTFDSDEDILKGLKSGANAYLSKKEVRSQLIDTIETILQKASMLSQRKVLVVDDSAPILELLEDALQRAGFSVMRAQSGREAMAVLAQERPDLILSDIYMPDLNGFEFCKRVKAHPDWSRIPFVVMSTNEDRGHMQRMIQHGAAAYIIKPFNLHQLIILLEKILSDNFMILHQERERVDGERRLLIESITSLISALEARDPYTRGHSEAVSRITAKMAALAGASQAELDRISIGCRLHDIGKIGVRDSVLLKPGKLTEAEFEHIKQHPVIGRAILQSIPSLRDILPIVYNHHERWDGRGYPEGLKGEEIPFWARLTSVADTFHSLTSDRPYRSGMPPEKAFEIIRDVRGSQLCPESVDIFWRLIDATPDIQSLILG